MILFALAAVGGIIAPLARADGDPASDYLLTRQVFLSATSTGRSGPAQQLESVVRAANVAGFRLRVAVIPSAYDLGSVVPLWLRPRAYARFLGTELSLVYRGRLLVVMPNGFGFYWRGHSGQAFDALLRRVPVGAGAAGLDRSAALAVQRLAAAGGVTVNQSTEARRPSGGAVPAGVWVAIVCAAALLGVGGAAWRRRRHRRPGLERVRRPTGLAPALRPLRRREHAATSVDAGGRAASPLARRLPVLAPLTAGLAAVAVVAFVLLRPGPAGSSPATVKSGPAFRWGPGRHLAPDFHLTDQNGRPVSLQSLHGRPVIITFVDPLCRNLCPLEAHVLNAMVRTMPASNRPVIVAVSVDIYADTRADLLQDFSKWSLVPQWRWAVGPPKVLAAVWKDYGIGVSVDTKRIAGTAVHEITHIEGSYVIDGTGHLRALFLWPFTPQDVETTLQRLS